MAICKFFLNGNCKFGEHCKNEHPRQHNSGNSYNAFSSSSSNQQNNISGAPRRDGGRGNFNNTRQQGGGFGGGRGFGGGGRGGGQRDDMSMNDQNAQAGSRGRGGGFRGGRGRGGFQGRGNGRRNNRISSIDTYSITEQTLEVDLLQERPEWACSCYGPGKDPPINLIGGGDIEVSPEELRVDHYLKLVNNQGEDSATVEKSLMEEVSGRINAIVNDPQGALEYVAAGKDEHPNRHDTAQKFRPNRHENPWGQFTRENQRLRRGVFKDQPRPPRNNDHPRGPAQSGFNSGPVNTRNLGTGFGANNAFGSNSNTAAEPSDIFNRHNLPAAIGSSRQQGALQVMNHPQPMNSGAFGGTSAPGAFGQQFADSQMTSPTQPAFNPPFQVTGFSQNQQLGAFGGPQQPQNVLEQTSNPGGNQQHTSSLGSLGTSFSRTNSPRNGLFGQLNGAGKNEPSGVAPQSEANDGSQKPSGDGMRDKLKAAYDYMSQHGRFKNGFIPETAPESDWIS